MVAIIGRSGSGKSTLLRCMNGLENFQQGRIEIAGHEVTHDPVRLRNLRKDVGIVFQTQQPLPAPDRGQERHRRLLRITQKVPEKEARVLAEKVLDTGRPRRKSSTPIPTSSSPAASSSASPSPAPWPCGRR